MASQAQIQANRQNAQKSTGPRTPEGKATVSRNAIKHGLFTNDAIIAGESIEEYNHNREMLLNEFNPIGQMETILAERIVTLTWRLKRIERFQNIVIDSMLDNEVHDTSRVNVRKCWSDGSQRHKEIQDNANYIIGNAIIEDYKEPLVLDRLSIYERRIESSLYRTMSELKRLQHIRKQMEQQKAKVEQNESRKFEILNSKSETISNNQNPNLSNKTACCAHSAVNSEKQSQLTSRRLENRNPKPEILNKYECLKEGNSESRVHCDLGAKC